MSSVVVESSTVIQNSASSKNHHRVLSTSSPLPHYNLAYSEQEIAFALCSPTSGTCTDWFPDWISLLVPSTDRADCEHFCHSIPDLCSMFIPVSIIGEGTFSTVYKAIDVQHYKRDNGDWIGSSLQDSGDAVRLWAIAYMHDKLRTTVCNASLEIWERKEAKEDLKYAALSPLITTLRNFVLQDWLGRAIKMLSHRGVQNPDEHTIAKTMKDFPPHFIAIKRINATSSPTRILDELSYLRVLGGRSNVIPIITGYRFEDQVLVVFPYFFHLDFRVELPRMTLSQIRDYMRMLFESLAWIHQQGIIHRDIKPSNFLYSSGKCWANGDFFKDEDDPDEETCEEYVKTLEWPNYQDHPIHCPCKRIAKAQLVDFGLAQRWQGIAICKPQKPPIRQKSIAESVKEASKYLPSNGAIINDPRPAIKASRAGTRGFRAPEVLFKCHQQGTSIDIWSAGVILLTLLTRRYPFFQSSDDHDALVEIACIVGKKAMQTLARSLDREWHCNVPSVPEEGRGWRNIICSLIPSERHEDITDSVIDLLDKCLCLNPTTRITAKEALKHSFFTEMQL